MAKLIVNDIRVIFNEEEQEFVIGCHKCQTTDSKSLEDIPGISMMVPVFITEHMRKCGTKSVN